VATTVTDPSGAPFVVWRHPATRPLTGFTRISLFESTADSRYDGLAFELKRRFARGFQFIAAYTFSEAVDNKPDQTMVVVGTDDVKGLQNNLDIGGDYARSDLDIRHRFVFSPVYEIGSPIFTKSTIRLGNGREFTVIAHHVSARNKYIQSAELNGKPLKNAWYKNASQHVKTCCLTPPCCAKAT